MTNDILQEKKFSDIDLSDSFFDSLRESYDNFTKWFQKKANQGSMAYTVYQGNDLIGFLYLKDEKGEDNSISPDITAYDSRLKIGTFKIKAHGTILGNRFLSIILHRFVENNYDACYVTLFNSVQGLKELFSSYGFKEFGKKTDTGEVVMIRTKRKCGGPYQEYPAFESFGEKFLLGIHPKFHTQLFPDSKLSTEKEFVTEDLSETNSITKVYLTNMYAMRDCQFQEGDKLIIYRTADRGKAAEWSAVATSVGTITAYKNIDEFASFDEFKRFTTKYSIFTNDELLSFWKSKRYPYVIKFIYNAAFPHRVTRHDLIEKCGIDRENYAGFMHLSDEVFSSIIKESDLNEGYVIN